MKVFLSLFLPSLCRTLQTKRGLEGSNVKWFWGSLLPKVCYVPTRLPDQPVRWLRWLRFFVWKKSQRPFCSLELLFKPVWQRAAAERDGNEEPPAGGGGARRGALRTPKWRNGPGTGEVGRDLWRPPGPRPAEQGHPEHGARDGTRRGWVSAEGEAPQHRGAPRAQPEPPGLSSRSPPGLPPGLPARRSPS